MIGERGRRRTTKATLRSWTAPSWRWRTHQDRTAGRQRWSWSGFFRGASGQLLAQLILATLTVGWVLLLLGGAWAPALSLMVVGPPAVLTLLFLHLLVQQVRLAGQQVAEVVERRRARRAGELLHQQWLNREVARGLEGLERWRRSRRP